MEPSISNKALDAFNSYFNPHIDGNKDNAISVPKVITYCTLIVPLIMAAVGLGGKIVKELSSLFGRGKTLDQMNGPAADTAKRVEDRVLSKATSDRNGNKASVGALEVSKNPTTEDKTWLAQAEQRLSNADSLEKLEVLKGELNAMKSRRAISGEQESAFNLKMFSKAEEMFESEMKALKPKNKAILFLKMNILKPYLVLFQPL